MLACPVMRALISILLFAVSAQAAKNLEIFFIDTEGGQATLVVSPSGQSLLIDTGYTGFGGRDANRIAVAAKLAHVKKINVLFLTHHHKDHEGGVKNLLQVLPVESFWDHGENVEDDKSVSDAYNKARGGSPHTVYKPGDKVPIKDLDVTVVMAANKHIETKGEANPFCPGLKQKDGEAGENPQSGGLVLQFGAFRFADLGDNIWNEELALLCPENRVGKVDLLLTPHHGTHVSPAADYAMAPRVVIMNDGPTKGGKPEAYQMWRGMKGLEDLWELHFALGGGKDGNSPDTFIANIDEKCEGKYLKVTAHEDGSFTVYNSRNKFTKTYAAR
jgi:competence protein ComEC